MSAPDRRAMLDRADAALSVRRQCTLLSVARSGVYRAAKPANDNDAALMRRIDELFTAWPFLGSRRTALGFARRWAPDQIDRPVGRAQKEPASNVSAPPSNSATTGRLSTRPNTLGSALHSVCIGPPFQVDSSRSRKTTFA